MDKKQLDNKARTTCAIPGERSLQARTFQAWLPTLSMTTSCTPRPWRNEVEKLVGLFRGEASRLRSSTPCRNCDQGESRARDGGCVGLDSGPRLGWVVSLESGNEPAASTGSAKDPGTWEKLHRGMLAGRCQGLAGGGCWRRKGWC